MTTSPEDRILEHLRARLREALAKMKAAGDEVARFMEEYEKVYGPLEKKKLGRPTVWKGSIGMVLVKAVEEILIRELRQEENTRDLEITNRIHAREGGRRYSLAQAIRKAVRTHPKLQKHKDLFGRLSDRALQARYQMAADYHSDSRAGARVRASEAAMKRLREAREEVDRLRDFLDD